MGSRNFDEADAIRTLSTMFAGIDDPQFLADNPVKERYLQAIRRARAGDFEAALEGFIEWSEGTAIMMMTGRGRPASPSSIC